MRTDMWRAGVRRGMGAHWTNIVCAWEGVGGYATTLGNMGCQLHVGE